MRPAAEFAVPPLGALPRRASPTNRLPALAANCPLVVPLLLPTSTPFTNSRSTDWLAPGASRQLPAICTQVPAPKPCTGEVVVSTTASLEVTRSRSAPPASRCRKIGMPTLPLASSSMAALLPDHALA